MIVYLARNSKNGKAYVGKTERALEQRIKEHVRFAGKDSPQPFHRAIRKHGIEAFEWSVLVEGDCTHEELDLLEQDFIERLGTFGSAGYNATRGGDGVRGWSPTPEHREKIRQAHLGEKNHNYGKKDWGRKGPWSEETKQKMSESHLGKQHTIETRQKIATAQYVRVEQLDMSGNLMATYDSMLHAEQVSGCGRQGISRACRFPHRSCGGYRWRYAEAANRAR